jgi:hypothetical protein
MKRNQTATLPLLAAALLGVAFTATAFAPRSEAQPQNSAPSAPQQNSPSKPTQSGTPQSGDSMPADMPGMQMPSPQPASNGTSRHASQNSDAAQAATQAMSGDMSGHMSGDGDMDMNAHMRMTALRPGSAADQKRAAEIVATVRQSIAKYEDYHVALADGFRIFAPNVPQKHYHFTSRRNAIRAQFIFDPARPTSLLYKKTADGYQLEGAMYTAPRRYTEDQLNERVPLSVARWHQHVDFCLPPRGAAMRQADWKEFGLEGSIATEQACQAAGGRWFPVVFGWMVHVYPFESDPAKIWAH